MQYVHTEVKVIGGLVEINNRSLVTFYIHLIRTAQSCRGLSYPAAFFSAMCPRTYMLFYIQYTIKNIVWLMMLTIGLLSERSVSMSHVPVLCLYFDSV